MTVQIPEVDLLTDTFETFILRVNELIEITNEQTLTANTSLGVTGSELSPRNARLFGTFEATQLQSESIAVGTGLTANNSGLYFLGSSGISANGSFGTNGQVLSRGPTGLFWASVGSGTVSSITAGNGVVFTNQPVEGPLTTTGTISLRAGAGIIINSAGINVDPNFIAQQSSGNATTLLNATWNAPGEIGSVTPNTGRFTLVTANAGVNGGYRIFGDGLFTLTSTLFRTGGWIDATTPNAASTGGLRIRSNGTSGLGFLQFTTNDGTSELGHFRMNANGLLEWSGNLRINGALRNSENIEYGLRSVPQIAANASTTISTNQGSGRHYYKTTTAGVNLTIPDNATESCPVGTTITFINDAGSGNLVLVRGGATELQAAGSGNNANLTITPRGIATAIKVTANKWIVSGSGVE